MSSSSKKRHEHEHEHEHSCSLCGKFAYHSKRSHQATIATMFTLQPDELRAWAVKNVIEKLHKGGVEGRQELLGPPTSGGGDHTAGCAGRNYLALLLHRRAAVERCRLGAEQVFAWARLLSDGKHSDTETPPDSLCTAAPTAAVAAPQTPPEPQAHSDAESPPDSDAAGQREAAATPESHGEAGAAETPADAASAPAAEATTAAPAAAPAPAAEVRTSADTETPPDAVVPAAPAAPTSEEPAHTGDTEAPAPAPAPEATAAAEGASAEPEAAAEAEAEATAAVAEPAAAATPEATAEPAEEPAAAAPSGADTGSSPQPGAEQKEAPVAAVAAAAAAAPGEAHETPKQLTVEIPKEMPSPPYTEHDEHSISSPTRRDAESAGVAPELIHGLSSSKSPGPGSIEAIAHQSSGPKLQHMSLYRPKKPHGHSPRCRPDHSPKMKGLKKDQSAEGRPPSAPEQLGKDNKSSSFAGKPTAADGAGEADSAPRPMPRAGPPIGGMGFGSFDPAAVKLKKASPSPEVRSPAKKEPEGPQQQDFRSVLKKKDANAKPGTPEKDDSKKATAATPKPAGNEAATTAPKEGAPANAQAPETETTKEKEKKKKKKGGCSIQ
eukprot:m51a1_g10893 hypothetical protein (608) ;mRNA; r:16052-18326